MPTSLHQGIVSIFRDAPTLAFELMHEVFGIELPALVDIHDRKSELDRFAPCFGDSGELRPDLAISGRAAEDMRGGAAMIIEVQTKVDAIKRWRIWVYWALLAERLGLSTAVMMVPLSDAVSRWARGLGELELPARHALLVLDRHNMPRLDDLDEARRRPSKAILSSLVHAVGHDLEMLCVGLKIALGFKDDRRWRYASSLLSALPTSQREVVLGALKMEERYELTELERNSVAYHDGLRDGRQEGRQEGRHEGRLDSLARLVLTILELRHIAVDASVEQRVRACRDPDALERWAERAKRVDELAALFDPAGP